MIGLLLMKENVFFGFFPHPESSSPQSHPVLEIPRGSGMLLSTPSQQPWTVPCPSSRTLVPPQWPAEGTGAMGCHWRPGASPGPTAWSTQTLVHLSSGCIQAAPLTQKHVCTLRLWALLLGSHDVRQAMFQWWVEMKPPSLTPTHSPGSHYESPFPRSPHPYRPPGGRAGGLSPFLFSMQCWGPAT